MKRIVTDGVVPGKGEDEVLKSETVALEKRPHAEGAKEVSADAQERESPKSHLKTATLLSSTAHSQSIRPKPASLPPINSVNGMRGRRMDFS